MAEGVPVKVSCEVLPEQIGDCAVTFTLIEDVTVITKLIGVEQLLIETWVKVIIVPAGQVVQAALILLGPILAAPDGLKTKLPEPPEEVDQVRLAKAVPVKFIDELDPGHKLVDVVRLAIGGATTVIVPVAFTEPQPPVRGME